MAKKNDFITKVDAHVGRKIRELRIAFGKTREEIAVQIGITHQQLAKYENGSNRISIGRLILIAGLFGKSPSYFYEDVDQYKLKTKDESRQRLALEYSRNFQNIKSSYVKEAVNRLVIQLGKERQDKEEIK